MGLDQNWLVRTTNNLEEEPRELHYHRKVPALQAFMRDEYLAAGGEHTDFNCEELYITQEILDRLKQRCTNRTLPEDASGFFWGSHCEDDYEDISEAINKAQKEIDRDNYVTYTAWY